MMEEKRYTFEELTEIVKILREKCPWDSTQTHESLKYVWRKKPRR